MDCSSPGSSVQGISQQEYWSGLPFPSAEDLPNAGTEPGSPALARQALLPAGPPGKPMLVHLMLQRARKQALRISGI